MKHTTDNIFDFIAYYTFQLIDILKILMAQPNGLALSCGVTNFQYATSEVSSC
jgi:hypothetical protein